MNSQQSWKTVLVILSLSSILMSVSYTMLIPFLPMYLMQELGVAQSDVNIWSGVIFSASFLISGIMAPIWGAMTAGGVLGPLAGGVLAEAFDMRTTFFLGGAALFVITLLLIFFIKEPKRKPQEKKESASKEKTNLLKIPVVQRMLLCAGIVQLTILLQQPVMPLYVGELQGSMDRIVFVTGLLFSIVGVSGVIASPVWGVIGQRWGFRPALYTALFGTAVFGMIQAIPDTLVPFGIWRFIGGLTFAGIFPAINAVLTNSTNPEDRGRIFGLSYAAQQVGSVIGPILGGALAMWFGIKFVVFFSGFVLLPLVIFLYLRRPKEETSTKGNEAKLG